MGHRSIVTGYIILKEEKLDNDIQYFNSYLDDGDFPWIRKEMFSIPNYSIPYYYDNPIVSFGATYKRIDEFLTSWLEKFENILRHVSFESANISLETGVNGNYHFYWEAKGDSIDALQRQKEKAADHLYQLIEADDWFYGYGIRDSFGTLQCDDNLSPFMLPNFCHPSKKS